jgi:hypothetical protein
VIAAVSAVRHAGAVRHHDDVCIGSDHDEPVVRSDDRAAAILDDLVTESPSS